MKISLLKLKNCLGIKEFELKPGQVTIIQGTGKQGKTSILDSIEKALYNTSKRPKFVHGDEDKAETYLLLDDGMEIKKSINPDGKVTSVKIEKDGMSPKSPETFLKNLIGDKQLNPVEFISKNDKEQVDTILSLVPITVTEADIAEWVGGKKINFVNFDQHGLKICKDVEEKLFNVRAETNKAIKLTSADVENLALKLPPLYKVDDWRDVSLSEKYEEIAAANKVNEKVTLANTLIDGLEAKIALINSDINTQIATLEQQIVNLKEKAQEQAAAETKKVEQAKEFLANNTVIDIAPLEDEIKEAEEMKSYVRVADELQEKKKLLADLELDAADLTSNIEIMRKKPTELLAKADMPISGLSVDEKGGILINNMPIKNLCGTEKIEFALEVAKATSKELKVILVDGVEALSNEDMNTFVEKCKADDEYQYIITRVTDGALRIIDGDGEILN